MTDESSKIRPVHLPEPSPIEHGGRVELRLISTGEGTTLYAARWFTESEQIEGRVAISPAGPVINIDAPETLPAWLNAFTTSLVRTTARQAVQDDSWPRRLTRWRRGPSSPGPDESPPESE